MGMSLQDRQPCDSSARLVMDQTAYHQKDVRRNLWGRAVSLRTSNKTSPVLIARQSPKSPVFGVEVASQSQNSDFVQVVHSHNAHQKGDYTLPPYDMVLIILNSVVLQERQLSFNIRGLPDLSWRRSSSRVNTRATWVLRWQRCANVAVGMHHRFKPHPILHTRQCALNRSAKTASSSDLPRADT